MDSRAKNVIDVEKLATLAMEDMAKYVERKAEALAGVIHASIDLVNVARGRGDMTPEEIKLMFAIKEYYHSHNGRD